MFDKETIFDFARHRRIEHYGRITSQTGVTLAGITETTHARPLLRSRHDRSQHDRYKLLISLVIPRPIALVTTVGPTGVVNAAPFSFFNMFSEYPPLCVLGLQAQARRRA